MRPTPQEVPGGAPLGRIDRGLREHPAPQQDSYFLGVDLVIFGLSAMDGLHREGMTQDKRDLVLSTEVSKPVPGKQTFGSQDNLPAVGSDGLEERLRGGLHVTVQ